MYAYRLYLSSNPVVTSSIPVYLGFIMLEFSRKLSMFCELIFFELSIKFRNKNTASYRAHINWLLRQNFSLSEEDPLKFCPTDG